MALSATASGWKVHATALLDGPSAVAGFAATHQAAALVRLAPLGDTIARLQDIKADKTAASDRWTGSQQVEYMRYVDARFGELANEIRRYHRGEVACK